MNFIFKRLLFIILLSFGVKMGFAQNFSIDLNTPADTAPWTFGGGSTGSSTMDGDTIILTPSQASRQGYISYDSSKTLTDCKFFHVKFDFKISNPLSGTTYADGLAFWFIGNPPSIAGTSIGSTLGLPSSPVGLVLIFDTYHNTGSTTNPLVSLRYLNGTDYIEGSTTGQLTSDVGGQSWITDGTWHTIDLDYSFGLVKVFKDGSTTPFMTGYTNQIPTPGYFGFSASTGASASKQSIKNISISGISIPNAPGDSTWIYCEGDSAVPLTANGTNLTWYTQQAGGTGTTIAPTPSTATPDTVIYYVSQKLDNCDQESPRSAIKVITRNRPSADFNYNIATGCIYDTVKFTYVGTGSSSDAFKYDFGNGDTSIVMNPNAYYNTPGTYQVYLKTTNGYCSDTSYKYVVIHPWISDSFAVDKDSICQGQYVTFTSYSTGYGLTYSYAFQDSTSFTGAPNPVPHPFLIPGSFNVGMKVTDFRGCSKTEYQTIQVDSMGVISLAGLRDSICVGEALNLTSNYRNLPSSYVIWKFGDGDSVFVTDSSVQHAYLNPGTYYITEVGHFGQCGDTTLSTKIKVNATPALYLGSDTTLCPNGAPILLYDQTNTIPSNAIWKWNTGATTPTYKVTEPGTYTALVNLNGCYATDEVIIQKGCYINIPNAFTPNGDGIEDYFFPKDLSSKNVVGLAMIIFNRYGQKVFETNNVNGRGWDGKLGGNDQSQGVYVYQLVVIYSNGVQEQYQGNVTLLR